MPEFQPVELATHSRTRVRLLQGAFDRRRGSPRFEPPPQAEAGWAAGPLGFLSGAISKKFKQPDHPSGAVFNAHRKHFSGHVPSSAVGSPPRGWDEPSPLNGKTSAGEGPEAFRTGRFSRSRGIELCRADPVGSALWTLARERRNNRHRGRRPNLSATCKAAYRQNRHRHTRRSVSISMSCCPSSK